MKNCGHHVLYVPHHVIRAMAVVVALAAKVVEADADSAELLVADAVVPVHLALPPLHAPTEGDPRAPGGRFSRENFIWNVNNRIILNLLQDHTGL